MELNIQPETLLQFRTVAGSESCIAEPDVLLTSGFGFTILQQHSTIILQGEKQRRKAETPISPPTHASKIFKAMQQRHIVF